jgi:hypothetical protein
MVKNSGLKSKIRARMDATGEPYSVAARHVRAELVTPAPMQDGPGRDDRFGGHEFEYEHQTDLFRCSECGAYEVVARETDGPITLCTGLSTCC